MNMAIDDVSLNKPIEEPKPPRFHFGPALLVTAAFIGPGTVLTASKAGANYGFSLVWAVIFSILATVVLQEMAARLGIISGRGLAQAIRDSISNPFGRYLSLGLVLGAILIGNAAYQTGNLLGAAIGLAELLPAEPSSEKVLDASTHSNSISSEAIAALFGAIALVIIWIGRLGIVQAIMFALVGLMSLMFVLSAIACRPDWAAVCAGAVPSIPTGESWNDMSLFVIGLLGTTVVPYNLFLHASSAAETWHSSAQAQGNQKRILRASMWDTVISVLVGGIVTGSILITMSVAFSDSQVELTQTTQIADQLRSALGSWAGILFAVGLCAAGLTSSITAPIAAAYATAGCFNWPCKLSDVRLKLVASLVVVTGVIAAVSAGKSPMQVIILAQFANGLLLPLVAIFLVYVANQAKLMGKFKNSWLANALAVLVIVITISVAFGNLNGAIGKLKKMMTPEQTSSQSESAVL